MNNFESLIASIATAIISILTALGYTSKNKKDLKAQHQQTIDEVKNKHEDEINKLKNDIIANKEQIKTLFSNQNDIKKTLETISKDIKDLNQNLLTMFAKN